MVGCGGSSCDHLMGQRDVWFGGWKETNIFTRANLPLGFSFEGPAIVEEAGGTSIVPPGWTVTVDNSGELLCRHTEYYS